MKLTNLADLTDHKFMNLKAKFQGWVQAKLGLTGWARAWLAGNEGAIGGTSLGNPLTQVTWVYAAVTAKAEKLAQVPLMATATEASDTPLTTGPVVALLNAPGGNLDRHAFKELLSLWLDLRGEFFLVALDKAGAVLPMNRADRGDRTNRIGELRILSPDQMTEVVDGNELAGWRYQSAGNTDNFRTQALLPEEVVHCRRPNPFNHWRGLSPLTVARMATETDFTAATFMKGLLANNADTGVIVTTDQVLTPDQQEQIKGALRERKRAAGTPDRPLLLHGGMKLEKPSLAAADLQFLENRKFSRQEILAVFRVPDAILGFTEDANRSVSEQQAADWIHNVITPMARRIEGALSRILAPASVYFDFDLLPEMRAAWRARVDTGSKLFALGVPLNDINQALELGLPDYAWGEVGMLPYSIQPASAAMEPAAEPPAPPKKLQIANYGHGHGHVCAPADPGFEAKHRQEARLTKAKLARFWFEQRGRILKRLAEQVGTGKGGNCKLEIANCKLQIEGKAPGDSIDWEVLFDFAKETEDLKKLLKARVVATFEAGAQGLLAEIGMASFDLAPEAAIQFFEKRVNMIEAISQDKFDQIKSSLQEGLASGDNWEQLAQRVKTEYNDFTDYQAERVAQTETNMALNGGRNEGMIEAGVEKKAWKTAKLENVRASHKDAEERSLNGIPMDEPFANGLMYPGDPNGRADEVINCRCFMVPVLESKR